MAKKKLSERLISEFIGAFFFSLVASSNLHGVGEASYSTISNACALAVFIYCVAPTPEVSIVTAFNPAVSVAIFVAKKFHGGVKHLVLYVAVQILGAIAGATLHLLCFAGHSMMPDAPGMNPVYALTTTPAPMPPQLIALKGALEQTGGVFTPQIEAAITGAGMTVEGVQALLAAAATSTTPAGPVIAIPAMNRRPAMGVELWYTIMLSLVVLGAAHSKKATGMQYHGLAIGFVVISGGMTAARLGGTLFNPAITLGYMLSSTHMDAIIGLMMFAASIIGGAIAGGIYRFTNKHERLKNGKIRPAAKYVVEGLGAYFIAYTFTAMSLDRNVATPLAVGCALMAFIFAFGPTSGGHYNPAVTVGVLASRRGKISGKVAAIYSACQLLGAFLGAAAGSSTDPKLPPIPDSVRAAILPPRSWDTIFLVELCFTFAIVYTVLSVATVKAPLSQMFGFPIGMAVTMGARIAAPFSGAYLNPALALGAGLAKLINGESNVFVDNLIITLIGVLAGIVAAGIFRLSHGSEYAAKPPAALSVAPAPEGEEVQ